MHDLPGPRESESGLRPCCCVCGRSLRAPESIEIGMGASCAEKVQQADQKRQEMDPEADVFLPIPFQKGIVLRRHGEWIIKTNVPHLVVHHSPTGFEFGYAGSGPADLALNIVEAMLNRFGYHGDRTSCFEGSCFSLAYRLHQAFKVDFIANAPRQGTVIPYGIVELWLEQRIVPQDEVLEPKTFGTVPQDEVLEPKTFDPDNCGLYIRSEEEPDGRGE